MLIIGMKTTEDFLGCSSSCADCMYPFQRDLCGFNNKEYCYNLPNILVLSTATNSFNFSNVNCEAGCFLFLKKCVSILPTFVISAADKVHLGTAFLTELKLFSLRVIILCLNW